MNTRLIGRTARLVVGLLAAAMIAAACGGSSTASGGSTPGSTSVSATTPATTTPAATASETSSTPDEVTPTTIGGETANVKATKDATGMSSLEIEADTDNGVNYFSPTIITGTPGQKITIELKNESSSVPHNFSIESLKINQDLDPGQSATVTVTLPASGSLAFFCEYHRSTGMIGAFTTG